jgi:hypothetical protein
VMKMSGLKGSAGFSLMGRLRSLVTKVDQDTQAGNQGQLVRHRSRCRRGGERGVSQRASAHKANEAQSQRAVGWSQSL